jgi:hypothetical protein
VFNQFLLYRDKESCRCLCAFFVPLQAAVAGRLQVIAISQED